jgi:hypothetical protein
MKVLHRKHSLIPSSKSPGQPHPSPSSTQIGIVYVKFMIALSQKWISPLFAREILRSNAARHFLTVYAQGGRPTPASQVDAVQPLIPNFQTALPAKYRVLTKPLTGSKAKRSPSVNSRFCSFSSN